MSNESSIPTQVDVLIVGAGAAGLYAALCLPSELSVALVTKKGLKVGASDWAQGGIAAAIAPGDEVSAHQRDTEKAGVGLCDSSAVKLLVEKAPTAINDLVNLGVAFDRRGEQLATTLEAAHSFPRVLHAADTTGRAIVETLTAKVLKRQNIQVFTESLVLQLWVQEERCQGAYLLHNQQVQPIRAGAVIMASGGGGQVYERTTNPAVSTGDGVAIAWRAGALVRDLEFMQFHPTALTQSDAPPFLISEAVRGEGAHVKDSQGRRFLFDYHPDGELAPRDVVSRSIFSHLQKTGDSCAYLDFSPIPANQIQKRFPNIIAVCQRYGLNVFTDSVPVAPAAHYWMGGIATDAQTRTSLPGLFALGETASTGVHGANRLASNSLLECLVYAQQLTSLSLAERTPIDFFPQRLEITDWSKSMGTFVEVRTALPSLMWKYAGICRQAEGLKSAIASVETWRKQLASFAITQYCLSDFVLGSTTLANLDASSQLKFAAETLNLLDIAYLILKSAHFREESRGGHSRDDYPCTNADWQVHTGVVGNHWFKQPLENPLTVGPAAHSETR